MRTISRRSTMGIVTLFAAPLIATAQRTPLDEYVAKPDDSYRFHRYATERSALYTTYFITMSSKQWRNAPGEVDRSVWEHHLSITVPHIARVNGNRTAIL